MAKQDRLNDLLIENGTAVNPADIAEIIHDRKTVNITPAPMPIQQALDIYKHLDEAGKGYFIDCFHEDDREVLRKALEDAGEIIYDEGGLHEIKGTCIAIFVDSDDADENDPSGDYTIETENRLYRVYLNLPLGASYSPQNAYPAIGEQVIILAENITEDALADTREDKDGAFLGYAEHCQVVDRTA